MVGEVRVHSEERDRIFLLIRKETGDRNTVNCLTRSKEHSAYPGGPAALTSFRPGQTPLERDRFAFLSATFSGVAPGCVLRADKAVPCSWPTFLGSLTPRGRWRRLPCPLPGGYSRAGPSRARKCPGVGVTCRNNLLIPRRVVGSDCGSPVSRSLGRSPRTPQP